MAKLNWVIFCERSVVDSSSNSLSVMNILEEVRAMQPPVDVIKAAAGRPIGAPLSCAIVMNWERSQPNRPEGATSVMLRLVNPKGSTLLETQLPLDLRKSLRARLTATLSVLPADLEGTYRWRVLLQRKTRWVVEGEVNYAFSFFKSAQDAERIQRAARKSAATYTGGVVTASVGKGPPKRAVKKLVPRGAAPKSP
jgi:hypothetical protein